MAFHGKHTEEAKRKISEARRLRKATDGFLNSPETRRKISEAQKGKRRTPAHRKAISEANKGKHIITPDHRKKLLANARYHSGSDHHSWRGDAVGYGGVHQWLYKTYGKADRCDRCGTLEAKRYEWANISLEYKRDRTDWEMLCTSCHRKEGYARGEYVTWNKGKKTGLVPRTAIKPGQHLSPATEFKPGRNKVA